MPQQIRSLSMGDLTQGIEMPAIVGIEPESNYNGKS
jgi:hypothetical protein